jgi:hypothetical protein
MLSQIFRTFPELKLAGSGLGSKKLEKQLKSGIATRILFGQTFTMKSGHFYESVKYLCQVSRRFRMPVLEASGAPYDYDNSSSLKEVALARSANPKTNVV